MEKTVETHCAFCAMQCEITLKVDSETEQITGVEPRDSGSINRGKMCVKGAAVYQQIHHKERIKRPLIRENAALKGTSLGFREASWQEAYQLIARRFLSLKEKFGNDSLSVLSGVSMTNEKCYTTGKFARIALQTRHIDNNGRFCLSSASAGFQQSFGTDLGSTLPWSEMEQTDCILLAGSNTAECHPTFVSRIWKMIERGGQLIVVDPRRTAMARRAAVHLDLRPGTDLALANGLLHLLIQNGYIDWEYVSNHTGGFDEAKELVVACTPEITSEITGVDPQKIRQAAEIFGRSPHAVVMLARGVEQQHKGVDNVSAYVNLALATGKIGRPKSGVATFTGQANGQGARLHGQKSDLLPGGRKITNPEHVKEISRIWGIDPQEMPAAGVSFYEMLGLMSNKEIRGLYLLCTNPAVSAPNQKLVRQALESLDFMVCCDFFLSETAEYADVVLPSVTWAEDEGTVTNFEGRFITINKALEPVGEAKPDWLIQAELAEYLGRGEYFRHFKHVSDISAEFTLAANLTEEQMDPGYSGFAPMFMDHRFSHPDGRARIRAVPYRPPAEEPCKEYPLRLTTGRVISHYLSGNQTRRLPALQEKCPEPYVELNPLTAQVYQVEAGEMVRLYTRRGEINCRVKLSKGIRQDTVFVPYHFGHDQCINLLTNDALDPVSKMPEFKACAAQIEKIVTA